VFVPEHLNINLFHTFVGLGFLDIHVEMTVDSAQNVTSVLSLSAIGQVTNLPIAPGDAMSASLCLNTNPAGTANYFVANETTGQTVNLTVDTGFPPAVTIDAGVTRDLVDNNPTISPLARFGVVYFDEISAFSTGGSQSLTAGQAVTMTDSSGSTLASPSVSTTTLSRSSTDRASWETPPAECRRHRVQRQRAEAYLVSRKQWAHWRWSDAGSAMSSEALETAKPRERIRS